MAAYINSLGEEVGKCVASYVGKFTRFMDFTLHYLAILPLVNFPSIPCEESPTQARRQNIALAVSLPLSPSHVRLASAILLPVTAGLEAGRRLWGRLRSVEFIGSKSVGFTEGVDVGTDI